MNKLKVNLENCYGIKKLEYTFDLEIKGNSKGVYSIYAPNGFMKSSFARTFEDIQMGNKSRDVVFTERETVREVTIDGEEIAADNVFVIKPYNESYSSEKTSLLLVNEELKKQYDEALADIDKKQKELIKHLKSISGVNSRSVSIESLLCSAFAKNDKDLFDLLVELQQSQEDCSSFSEIKYGDIFNDKVLKILKSGNLSQELEDYIETYDSLVAKSPVLSREFNHQNAATITKNLHDTGFFGADHTININFPDGKKEITSQVQLQELIEEEQNKVISDPKLQKQFAAIDKKLSNAETRKFREFITDHKELLPELKDYEEFERKLWLSYLQQQPEILHDFTDSYTTNKQLIAEITEKAKEQQTTWETVVDTFNKRFNVPFVLRIDNQEDVILQSAQPTIAFDFKDGRENKSVNKSILIEVLSQGEKRALYILNLLFEIEVRNQQRTPTLFVIDDIADSFDYKNKYSIVEYLQVLANTSFFKIIILTHNFDFHRTVCGRVGVYGKKRLFTIKTDEKVELIREKYQKDVLNYWKSQLGRDQKCVLACIPFARNLAEYCGLENEYHDLTSLLHLKANTNDFRISDLQVIYRKVFNDRSDVVLQNATKLIIHSLIECCDAMVAEANDVAQLEDKIILSIAIRLEAERYMIRMINDDVFVQAIETSQTKELFERFVSDFGDTESESIVLLDQVNLMTPENIHLNSFMYEPILDLSAQHLYQLYQQIKQLNVTDAES
ncbi:hypothetical protein tloyanaT_32540 [Thalassotalea loyana]|uniref:Phage infection protein n=1 Tax=Thalassotalea loyana TaxID=280483 RepID=A0ABQ6HJ03_9GAMM|nr:hypothetical protein [Thalassotalea loyana]GLX87001.1 hypothetical protein tloyanaT_32540 [Thalassotalea loyana]